MGVALGLAPSTSSAATSATTSATTSAVGDFAQCSGRASSCTRDDGRSRWGARAVRRDGSTIRAY